MSIDLTRWNRSGLRRLEYVDGNAVTYFSLLRKELAKRFNSSGNSKKKIRWEALEEGGAESSGMTDSNNIDIESTANINERMLAFYSAGNTNDIGLEITRTLARSSHILTEYIDAYANENYLGTATQWENVRRLVAMLDYHPSPPASAATTLVLAAKSDRTGKVAKGELQVKHTPIDGSAPLVFENLEDIDVDPLNNELRVENWNRSEQAFNPFALIDKADATWQMTTASQISTGQLAVVIDRSQDSRAVVAQVEEISPLLDDSGETYGAVFQLASILAAAGGGAHWIKGATHCLAVPKDILVPHLNGKQVVQLERETSVVPGQVVAWLDNNRWVYARVRAAEASSLELVDGVAKDFVPQFIAENRLLYSTLMIARGVDGYLDVPSHVKEAVYFNAEGDLKVLNKNDFEDAQFENNTKAGKRLLQKYAEVTEVFVLAQSTGEKGVNIAMSLARVINVAPTRFYFSGKPGKLASGDWAVGVTGFGQSESLHALKISKVVSFDQHFELEFEQWMSSDNDTLASASLTLSSLLYQLQMTLDNTVFNQFTIDDIAQGVLANQPIIAIQGIGKAYSNELTQVLGYSPSIRDLSLLSVANLSMAFENSQVSGIPSALLLEFIGKSRALMALKCVVPTSIAGRQLSELVDLLLLSDDIGTMPVGKPDDNSVNGQLAGPGLLRLYTNFSEIHQPIGHNINTQPITDFLAIQLAGKQFSSYLKAGRRVILEQKNLSLNGEVTYQQPLDCTIDDVTSDARGHRIKLRDLPDDIDTRGFTKGNFTLSANVVRAGHGIKREVKVLGSGNAASLNQNFVLEVDDLSFVADPSMPKGVRADIEVSVAGQIWYQVASLKDSRPSDPHYEVRITEEKYLRINFGDGMHGRRLPSGSNNIRVGFRSGHGLRGNLSANSLNKLAKPNRYIDDFRQPYASDGGNDMEEIDDIKENAPTSLLTIDRAVSLSDFANLAQSQASVWQARAIRKSDNRGTLGRVKVVLVPAGGLDLGEDGISAPVLPQDFKNNLQSFLESHSQPGVDIELEAYTPVIASIEIEPYIKSAEYEHVVVAEAVKAAVVEAFNLKQRKLGQSLYLSDVYKIVESIQGVEYSVCNLQPSPIAPAGIEVGHSAQVINGRLEQIIYVDEMRGSVIDVTPKEYEL